MDDLAEPSPLELAALRRIGAAPNVRLACQTRPRRDVSITPLVPARAGARAAYRPGGVQGHEQQVATLFIDLRGSTRLSEERFPYDVVFILNQFFAEMVASLQATRGHYAQFSGDGLMALYGLESGIEDGCRDALKGAVDMNRRLMALNQRLGVELREPLRIGIGIHCGEAIVGTMGPPSSPNLSAIGDNINIAARLEALTKDYDCTLVVSAVAAQCAGVDLSRFPAHQARVRGRDEPVDVYAISDPAEISGDIVDRQPAAMKNSQRVIYDMSSGFLQVAVSGRADERGFQHGRILADRIERTVEFYTRIFGQSASVLVELANHFKQKIREFNGEYATEIESVAEGAGLDSSYIYVLNARSELLSLKTNECTAIYFQKAGILGQNWDWASVLEPLTVLMRIEHPNGHVIQMITEPGIIGKIGLNSSGIGVCLNILRIKGRLDGLPVHVLLRAILDSQSIDVAKIDVE
jgi:class 3 adenylate cyclase